MNMKQLAIPLSAISVSAFGLVELAWATVPPTVPSTNIPEPGILALLGAGSVAIILIARLRRKK